MFRMLRNQMNNHAETILERPHTLLTKYSEKEGFSYIA
jgi:hypothetical protein